MDGRTARWLAGLSMHISLGQYTLYGNVIFGLPRTAVVIRRSARGSVVFVWINTLSVGLVKINLIEFIPWTMPLIN